MEIKLLKQRVLLEIIVTNNKTKGGLWIPETSEKKTQRAKVLAVADDCENVEVGDEVYFDEYAGTALKWEDRECIILKEIDLLAYVDQEGKKEGVTSTV